MSVDFVNSLQDMAHDKGVPVRLVAFVASSLTDDVTASLDRELAAVTAADDVIDLHVIELPGDPAAAGCPTRPHVDVPMPAQPPSVRTRPSSYGRTAHTPPMELVWAAATEGDAAAAAAMDGVLQAARDGNWALLLTHLAAHPEGGKSTVDGGAHDGKLPLHLAAGKHAPPSVVAALLQAHPEGAKTKDRTESKVVSFFRNAVESGGRLPLHSVFDGDATTLDMEPCWPRDAPGEGVAVARALLAAHPTGAGEKDRDGRTPLHLAAKCRAPVPCIEALLAACPGAAADTDEDGWLPLHYAVRHQLSPPAVRLLLDAHPAGGKARNSDGQDPFELAAEQADERRGNPASLELVELLRDFLATRGQRARRSFDDATLIHVLGTRFAGASHAAAANVKVGVEALGEHIACFNPNVDNNTLAGGLDAEANAIWLRRWREMLGRAAATGGRVVQVLSAAEGLSHMQHAEAEMAAERREPVVVIECGTSEDGLADLLCGAGLGQARAPEPSYDELAKRVATLTSEVQALRAELARSAPAAAADV